MLCFSLSTNLQTLIDRSRRREARRERGWRRSRRASWSWGEIGRRRWGRGRAWEAWERAPGRWGCRCGCCCWVMPFWLLIWGKNNEQRREFWLFFFWWVRALRGMGRVVLKMEKGERAGNCWRQVLPPACWEKERLKYLNLIFFFFLKKIWN